MQDDLPEYVKLLGFLTSGEQENGNCVDTSDAFAMWEVRFKRHIAYERQADSSKLLEHWVPAYISLSQLEIYCFILLSNSSLLQSTMKSDGFHRGILMSLSKVCFANKFIACICMITSNQSSAICSNVLLFFCEVTDTVTDSDLFLSLCYSAVITLALSMNSCKIRLSAITIMIVMVLLIPECKHVASYCSFKTCLKRQGTGG